MRSPVVVGAQLFYDCAVLGGVLEVGLPICVWGTGAGSRFRCLAGREGVDPFSGAATTGMAARQLGRTYIGVDVNPEFHDIGLRRLGLAADETRDVA